MALRWSPKPEIEVRSLVAAPYNNNKDVMKTKRLIVHTEKVILIALGVIVGNMFLRMIGL